MQVLRTFWGIRHKPTGRFLPEPLGRAGRGGSHTEPSATEPPRIFDTELGAKRALSAWLQGKFVCGRGYYPGHPGNDWESGYYEEVTVVKQPHRVREDMEVVPLKLVLEG